jgi:hypothetical protein
MGYFDDDSMLRQIQRESVVAFSGPRALLMQAAHPVAFAGSSRTPARSTSRTSGWRARRR